LNHGRVAFAHRLQESGGIRKALGNQWGRCRSCERDSQSGANDKAADAVHGKTPKSSDIRLDPSRLAKQGWPCHEPTRDCAAPGARRVSLLVAPVLLLLLLLGACQREQEAPPLAGSSVGGPFSLIDQNGNRVTDREFNGRYRLVYFGFANCPDVCPVDLQVAGAGLKQLEEKDVERAALVQPIFVTVDPARDTPEVLKSYVDNFHPRLIGLTGTEAEIEAAKKEFAIWSEKGEQAPGGGYNVNHSRLLLLFGPQGEPLAIVPHDQGPQAVAAELAKWVR
jgi:protein SCO1/2